MRKPIDFFLVTLHIGLWVEIYGAVGAWMQYQAMRESGCLHAVSSLGETLESLTVSVALYLLTALAFYLDGRRKEQDARGR